MVELFTNLIYYFKFLVSAEELKQYEKEKD